MHPLHPQLQRLAQHAHRFMGWGLAETCRASFRFSNKKHKVLSLIDKEECEVQIIDSKNYWDFIVFSDTFQQIQKAMPCRQVEDFSQKIASDFAAACRTDKQSEDCFGTAYNYGRDHVTRLTHDIIRLQRESGLSRKEIVESIKDLASHMNALSYVFLVAADVAEKALDHD